MDITKYSEIICRLLNEYGQIPYSYGELERRFIISEDKNSYLLMTLGWQGDKRVHSCLIHVEIKDNKVWIQRDGTEDGIAEELVAAGIPKQDIVLAFQPMEVRPYTEYAVN